MRKKMWILLCLYFGFARSENIFRSLPGFLFSWPKSSEPSTPTKSVTDKISINDKTIMKFNQNETGISIESTFPNIEDPAGLYSQSALTSDDYSPNSSENFYFQAGIEFYKWLNPKWLNPENYKNLLEFFNNLLAQAPTFEPLQLLYLVRFVDGIIQQMLFDLFNYNNESGRPDPQQAQIMQLTETVLKNQRPEFGTELVRKLSTLIKEGINTINQSSVAQLKNIEALLEKQQKGLAKRLQELEDKLSKPGLEKQVLETHKQELETQKQQLGEILRAIQNALQPSSEGKSPSGGSMIGFAGPAKPNSTHDPGLPA